MDALETCQSDMTHLGPFHLQLVVEVDVQKSGILSVHYWKPPLAYVLIPDRKIGENCQERISGGPPHRKILIVIHRQRKLDCLSGFISLTGDSQENYG